MSTKTTSLFARAATAFMRFIQPAPSVESIVADFEATRDRLLSARERHNADAKAAEVKAAEMIQRAVKSRAEAGRAHRVAAKVTELLS